MGISNKTPWETLQDALSRTMKVYEGSFTFVSAISPSVHRKAVREVYELCDAPSSRTGLSQRERLMGLMSIYGGEERVIANLESEAEKRKLDNILLPPDLNLPPQPL